MQQVWYDGWPLVYQPNSPAALHLLTLLAAHTPDTPALVGLPGESYHPLPESVRTLLAQTPDTDWGRLRWEQRLLPALARAAKADWLHLVGGSPALLGSTRTLVSPAGFSAGDLPTERREPRLGLAARLRQSFAQGGLVRAKALLWPDDLPGIQTQTAVRRLPPVVHPIFQPDGGIPSTARPASDELAALNLPETYLLYHGPGDEPAMHRLLDAWSWAAGSIGEYYPLVLIGLDRSAQDRLAALLAEYQLSGTARPLPSLSLSALAGVYRGCSGLFHPVESSPWGDPVRMALACGKPVVGLDSGRTAALAGTAGYLVSANEPYPMMCRALGAGLITVVVEDSLAETLSQAARERSASWQFDLFAQSLRECYRAD